MKTEWIRSVRETSRGSEGTHKWTAVIMGEMPQLDSMIVAKLNCVAANQKTERQRSISRDAQERTALTIPPEIADSRGK